MGTTVSIQAYGKELTLLHTAINDAFRELRMLDNLLSVYDERSEISRINQCAGVNDVVVSPETMAIVKHAVSFSRETNGVFDCTVEPLMRLWGFRNSRSTTPLPPSDEELFGALEKVGYGNIIIDDQNRSIGLRRHGCAIDLGGVAVGYTVDRLAAILRSHGIESAFINHSGDVYAIGTPPHSSGWPIGIPSLQNDDEFVYSFTIKDEALSTSASNEKFVVAADGNYSHIIDPKTGKPSKKQRGVSVVAPTSLQADTASTALFNSASSLPKSTNNGTKLAIYWYGETEFNVQPDHHISQ